MRSNVGSLLGKLGKCHSRIGHRGFLFKDQGCVSHLIPIRDLDGHPDRDSRRCAASRFGLGPPRLATGDRNTSGPRPLIESSRCFAKIRSRSWIKYARPSLSATSPSNAVASSAHSGARSHEPRSPGTGTGRYWHSARAVRAARLITAGIRTKASACRSRPPSTGIRACAKSTLRRIEAVIERSAPFPEDECHS